MGAELPDGSPDRTILAGVAEGLAASIEAESVASAAVPVSLTGAEVETVTDEPTPLDSLPSRVRPAQVD
jgi:hypothetical protein